MFGPYINPTIPPARIAKYKITVTYAGHLSSHFAYISFGSFLNFLQAGFLSGRLQQQHKPGHINIKTTRHTPCGIVIHMS